jgi:hypothetical protein
LAEVYSVRLPDLFHPVWGDRFRHRVRRALIDWPHKFIYSSDGKHELYDLEKDPAEGRNLSELQPDKAAELIERLGAYLAGLEFAEPPARAQHLSREQERVLRSLGY